MNLEEMKVEQLKALGFDLIGRIETAKYDLNIIQAELQKRSTEVKDEPNE